MIAFAVIPGLLLVLCGIVMMGPRRKFDKNGRRLKWYEKILPDPGFYTGWPY